MLLAESHLTRRLFGSMLHRIAMLAAPQNLILASGDAQARPGDSRRRYKAKFLYFASGLRRAR